MFCSEIFLSYILGNEWILLEGVCCKTGSTFCTFKTHCKTFEKSLFFDVAFFQEHYRYKFGGPHESYSRQMGPRLKTPEPFLNPGQVLGHCIDLKLISH